MRWDQIDFAKGHLHVRRLKGGIHSVHPIQGDELRNLRELKREHSPFGIEREAVQGFLALRVRASSLVSNFAIPILKNTAQKNRAYVRYRAYPFAAIRVSENMAAMLYVCPNTGFRVQGYTVDETVPNGHDSYEPVTCLACKLVHSVNPKSGKVFVAGGK